MRLPESKHNRARIEIVPMIDTIFFLLVYFMVASLTMTQMQSKKVTLPTSAYADQHPGAKVIVTITKQGACYVDETKIDEARIPDVIHRRLNADPNLAVVINCDKDQPVAAFSTVFDLVKQANPATVMVATTPKDNWQVSP